MTDSCDVLRLDATLDDDAGPVERAWASRHLASCDRCLSHVAERRRMDARLASLPATMAPARPLWDGIAARIGVTDTRQRGVEMRPAMLVPASGNRPWTLARTVWRAAAALALFVAGYAAGISRGASAGTAERSSSGPAADAGQPADPGQPADAAEEVQRLGSAWTASLARLGSVPATSAGVVARRREVALATMRGAASELTRIAPDRPGVVAAYDAIRAEHEQSGTRSGTGRGVAF
jgi:hypothetical protein